MTSEHLLAALRVGVPEVVWDPLHTGIHWDSGRETITGQQGDMVVTVDVLDDAVEVRAEWTGAEMAGDAVQQARVRAIGPMVDAPSVARRAVQAVSTAVAMIGGPCATVSPPRG